VGTRPVVVHVRQLVREPLEELGPLSGDVLHHDLEEDQSLVLKRKQASKVRGQGFSLRSGPRTQSSDHELQHRRYKLHAGAVTRDRM
jgi:hypothetical protein